MPHFTVTLPGRIAALFAAVIFAFGAATGILVLRLL